MPERSKLTPRQVRYVLHTATHGKWVVVSILDAAILGDGTGSLQALRNAKSKHPEMDLDEIAVMFVSELKQGKKPRERSFSNSFNSILPA